MKTRAVSIAEAGVPQVSIAVDTYFSRAPDCAHLIECLRSLQADFPTVAINLRITHNDHAGRRAFGSRRHVRIGGDDHGRAGAEPGYHRKAAFM
jgi:hypothetical protein